MPNAREPVERHGVERGHRKTKVGVVTSNRMAKTIVVRVSRSVRHPFYGRVIRRSNAFKAHDEAGRAAVGDTVKIVETRPISREKRWRLVEVLKQASSAPPVPGGEDSGEDSGEKPAPEVVG